jgi:hypothetical protein
MGIVYSHPKYAFAESPYAPAAIKTSPRSSLSSSTSSVSSGGEVNAPPTTNSGMHSIYEVTVPQHIKPGERFTVLMKGIGILTIECPEGNKEGDHITVKHADVISIEPEPEDRENIISDSNVNMGLSDNIVDNDNFYLSQTEKELVEKPIVGGDVARPSSIDIIESLDIPIYPPPTSSWSLQSVDTNGTKSDRQRSPAIMMR